VLDFSAFHLLRPQWLWALLPIAGLAILLMRQQDPTARWRGVIVDHLLNHLVVRPHRGWGLRPWQVLIFALVVLSVAVSGPTWHREQPPFTEDTSPLVIALDLSKTMTVKDVSPSRLDRAKQMARDLLERRKGAKTALLVYAGSAHTVLPLTDDPGILESFIMDLDPSIMPTEGKNAARALALAEHLLSAETTAGTILFLTDGMAAAEHSAFVAHREQSRDGVLVLAVATEAGGIPSGGGEPHALDLLGLERLRSEAGVGIERLTADDRDLERILRRIEMHLASVQAADTQGRWRDEGRWLAWPLAGLVLLWFRRGWLVRWEA
jgi:Ca-activated chloride channel family protein